MRSLATLRLTNAQKNRVDYYLLVYKGLIRSESEVGALLTIEQITNLYYKCSKILVSIFRYLLRLFTLDLTASDTARITGLGTRTINAFNLRLRYRFLAWNSAPAEPAVAVKLHGSYFGPPRAHGKRVRSTSSETIVFGPFKRSG